MNFKKNSKDEALKQDLYKIICKNTVTTAYNIPLEGADRERFLEFLQANPCEFTTEIINLLEGTQ